MRIPPASIQIASQLPDLLENLATATERLNTAIDRAERYMALAAPMVRTLDAVLPQLEALVATGNDVYTAVSSIPGVSTLDDWPLAPRTLQPERGPRESVRAAGFVTASAITSPGNESSPAAAAATSPWHSPVPNAAIE